MFFLKFCPQTFWSKQNWSVIFLLIFTSGCPPWHTRRPIPASRRRTCTPRLGRYGDRSTSHDLGHRWEEINAISTTLQKYSAFRWNENNKIIFFYPYILRIEVKIKLRYKKVSNVQININFIILTRASPGHEPEINWIQSNRKYTFHWVYYCVSKEIKFHGILLHIFTYRRVR